MDIDHIFIFTGSKGKVADQLVSFGLTEGSSRIHKGQGTTNRKFYFENFFLEILWVHDENETKSDLIKPTRLWQRANYQTNNFSPFGLCLVNTDETYNLFEKSLKYQPDYFPAGLSIDILPNENQPELPWTFRLPFKEQKKNEVESPSHANGIKRLTKAQFTYRNLDDDDFIEKFKNESKIKFVAGSDLKLALTFDDNAQRRKTEIEELNLTIEY
jgi:Glyoxalase-like domain